MKIVPSLSFNGQCESAFKFYETCLKGKTTFKMTYGESPMGDKTPADWKNKILHTSFELDGQIIIGADAFPGRYEKPQGFAVTLNIEDPSEAEKVFKALAEKGSVDLEIQETFWAKRFGMLTDQFGTPWMINCSKNPAPSKG